MPHHTLGKVLVLTQAGLKAGFISGTPRNTESSQVNCLISTGTNKNDDPSSPDAHEEKYAIADTQFWNCVHE